LPSGAKAREKIQLRPPGSFGVRKLRTSAPLTTSHRRMSPPEPAEARSRPSGEKATVSIFWECPRKV
jgi:hypothetical protein